jgi:biopolymer transport protein ExbD
VSEIPHTEDKATILVDLSGDLYLDNQPVDEEGLKAGLEAAFAQSKTPDEFAVLVKVDSTLPVKRLQNVLKLVKSVGLMKVSLATRRGGETS